MQTHATHCLYTTDKFSQNAPIEQQIIALQLPSVIQLSFSTKESLFNTVEICNHEHRLEYNANKLHLISECLL